MMMRTEKQNNNNDIENVGGHTNSEGIPSGVDIGILQNKN